MEFNKEDFKHYIIGENKICSPNDLFIIKLDYPRVYIRLDYSQGMFSDYDEFYNGVAEVQWLDGHPSKDIDQESILINMYNYLAIEERILDEDMEDIYFEDTPY